MEEDKFAMEELKTEESKAFKFPKTNTRSIAFGSELSRQKQKYLDLISSKNTPRSFYNWIAVSHRFGFVCFCLGDAISFVHPSHAANLLETDAADNLTIEIIYLRDDNGPELLERSFVNAIYLSACELLLAAVHGSSRKISVLRIKDIVEQPEPDILISKDCTANGGITSFQWIPTIDKNPDSPTCFLATCVDGSVFIRYISSKEEVIKDYKAECASFSKDGNSILCIGKGSNKVDVISRVGLKKVREVNLLVPSSHKAFYIKELADDLTIYAAKGKEEIDSENILTEYLYLYQGSSLSKSGKLTARSVKKWSPFPCVEEEEEPPHYIVAELESANSFLVASTKYTRAELLFKDSNAQNYECISIENLMCEPDKDYNDSYVRGVAFFDINLKEYEGRSVTEALEGEACTLKYPPTVILASSLGDLAMYQYLCSKMKGVKIMRDMEDLRVVRGTHVGSDLKFDSSVSHISLAREERKRHADGPRSLQVTPLKSSASKSVLGDLSAQERVQFRLGNEASLVFSPSAIMPAEAARTDRKPLPVRREEPANKSPSVPLQPHSEHEGSEESDEDESKEERSRLEESEELKLDDMTDEALKKRIHKIISIITEYCNNYIAKCKATIEKFKSSKINIRAHKAQLDAKAKAIKSMQEKNDFEDKVNEIGSKLTYLNTHQLNKLTQMKDILINYHNGRYNSSIPQSSMMDEALIEKCKYTSERLKLLEGKIDELQGVGRRMESVREAVSRKKSRKLEPARRQLTEEEHKALLREYYSSTYGGLNVHCQSLAAKSKKRAAQAKKELDFKDKVVQLLKERISDSLLELKKMKKQIKEEAYKRISRAKATGDSKKARGIRFDLVDEINSEESDAEFPEADIEDIFAKRMDGQKMAKLFKDLAEQQQLATVVVRATQEAPSGEFDMRSDRELWELMQDPKKAPPKSEQKKPMQMESKKRGEERDLPLIAGSKGQVKASSIFEKPEENIFGKAPFNKFEMKPSEDVKEKAEQNKSSFSSLLAMSGNQPPLFSASIKTEDRVKPAGEANPQPKLLPGKDSEPAARPITRVNNSDSLFGQARVLLFPQPKESAQPEENATLFNPPKENPKSDKPKESKKTEETSLLFGALNLNPPRTEVKEEVLRFGRPAKAEEDSKSSLQPGDRSRGLDAQSSFGLFSMANQAEEEKKDIKKEAKPEAKKEEKAEEKKEEQKKEEQRKEEQKKEEKLQIESSMQAEEKKQENPVIGPSIPSNELSRISTESKPTSIFAGFTAPSENMKEEKKEQPAFNFAAASTFPSFGTSQPAIPAEQALGGAGTSAGFFGNPAASPAFGLGLPKDNKPFGSAFSGSNTFGNPPPPSANATSFLNSGMGAARQQEEADFFGNRPAQPLSFMSQPAAPNPFGQPVASAAFPSTSPAPSTSAPPFTGFLGSFVSAAPATGFGASGVSGGFAVGGSLFATGVNAPSPSFPAQGNVFGNPPASAGFGSLGNFGLGKESGYTGASFQQPRK